MKYHISVVIQLRPEDQSRGIDWQNGLRVEFGASIIHDGTVQGAAAIMSRFEDVANQIKAEQKP